MRRCFMENHLYAIGLRSLATINGDQRRGETRLSPLGYGRSNVLGHYPFVLADQVTKAT